MAKLFIIDSTSGERIPFLRGVLVESMVRAGLPFEDAYQIAQNIRGDLEALGEVSSEGLRERVTAAVRKRFGAELAQAYELGSGRGRPIIIRTHNEEEPFSVGILTRCLQACAISRANSLETARQVHDFLQKGSADSIDHLALRTIIYEHLKVHSSPEAADRFLSWRQFRDSGMPLIILVGGITGTGKSTLTSELAYHLNIVRTQSTDMLREIVRGYLPPSDVPSLGYSSFEAWRGLRAESANDAECSEAEVIDGFLAQFNIVKHGLEATVHRAVKENHDLIVDGVHVLPWRLDYNFPHNKAIVVPMMLVVPSKKTLGKRLKQREREQPDRPSSRYLRQLEQIWWLQSYLVGEAEENKTQLIFNGAMEDALHEILLYVNHAITKHFPAEHP